jgi:hypothetical protein
MLDTGWKIVSIATQRVDVTTLDSLIAEYGVPGFCKIDVEGFESAVLQGLTSPIPALSFEFHMWTPEMREALLDCLAQLESLGQYQFNFSLGMTYTLALSSWVGKDELQDMLMNRLPHDAEGDIYAKLISA